MTSDTLDQTEAPDKPSSRDPTLVQFRIPHAVARALSAISLPGDRHTSDTARRLLVRTLSEELSALAASVATKGTAKRAKSSPEAA